VRLHSTQESIERGEISILAISECIVAIIVYVAIAEYYSSLWHYIFAVAVAPLWLLRTPVSQVTALQIWSGYAQKIINVTDKDNPGAFEATWAVTKAIFAPIFGIATRFVVTAYYVLTKPLLALQNIPDNWFRQTLSTDFFYYPEIVPGESRAGKSLTFHNLIRTISQEWKDASSNFSIILIIFALLLLVVGYVPAIIFRVTFKATSIVYLPLVFIALGTANIKASNKVILDLLVNGEREKLRIVLAKSIAVLAMIKTAVAAGFAENSFLADWLKSQQLAQIIFQDGAFPAWQLALFAEATITLGLFYFVAEPAWRRLQAGEPWSEKWLEPLIRLWLFVRALLATASAVLVAGNAVLILAGAA
jgi:hypothetical protein